MTLLEVRGLTAGYGAGDVLHGVDLDVAAGEVAVVLGANGAGKTTLMRALVGQIARRGEVKFDGRDIARLSTERIVRGGLALVPQGRGTVADLTVEENLQAGGLTRPRPEVARDMAHWYETFPRLADRRLQKAGLLSGGEQQMLAISRALMSKPKLLLCDEPSLGLSPLLTQEVFTSLRRINQELDMAILLVEQNTVLALGIADKGYLLETGDMSAARPAAELMEDDSIRAAYLGH